MKKKFIKALTFISIITTSTVVPLSNFVSASPVDQIEQQVQSSSFLNKNGNKVIQSTIGSTTASLEILEGGTDQNWTKLKIVQGNRVDYLEKSYRRSINSDYN